MQEGNAFSRDGSRPTKRQNQPRRQLAVRARQLASFGRRGGAFWLICWLISCLMAGPAFGQSRASVIQADYLFTGGAVMTMDGQQRQWAQGFVAVRGDRIVAVGEQSALRNTPIRARQVINTRGTVVMPGLINTHTHLPMVLYRGLGSDLDLQEWLTKYIFPAEAKNTTRDFVIWGARLGLIELIRGGCTTFADMYYFENDIARETKRAGMRAVLGETLIDFPAPDHKTWDEALNYTIAFVKRWQNDPLITPAFAPHAPYTVSTAHLQAVTQQARALNAHVLTHIAEAPTELVTLRERYQARPVEYLERIGFFAARVTGAHVVHVTNEEIQVLKQHEVGVAHCPQSNMKLSSGTAPIPQMLAAGLRVGLGTDGAASNNDLNLWEEMDTASKLHKLVTMNPTVVKASEALMMATIGGARALHLEKEIGSLETGKRADVIAVGLTAPHQTPGYQLASQLVYATKASDVRDVMVNGKFLLRARRLLTLPEATVLAQARRYQQRVTQSLANYSLSEKEYLPRSHTKKTRRP